MTDIQHITLIFALITIGICSSFVLYKFLFGARLQKSCRDQDFQASTGFVNQ